MEIFSLDFSFGNNVMTQYCPDYVGRFLVDVRAELRLANKDSKKGREQQAA